MVIQTTETYVEGAINTMDPGYVRTEAGIEFEPPAEARGNGKNSPNESSDI